ncbi:hypothetical protein SETIT_6G002800v2 [Setaria italica]|uniref:Transcription repressor n=2 Tax=Setaria italica TaxID=4555 RepID=A0A368RGM6_SETIT|nr:transcription repressor OFP13 [Setaria italica]RCV29311.1 hypothetical protein SETIT_6G002800v2 [Setaria italica]
MMKKQQLAVGGLSSLFRSSSNKQQDTSPTPGAVLPCRHSSSSSMSSSSYSAWQWTSCGLHPRTLSFRQLQQQEEDASRYGCQHRDDDSHMAMMKKQAAYYKTMNSSYSVDSCFSTNSLDSVDSFSTASHAEAEAVIRAVRSDRLLFEPEDASSFKAASKPNTKLIIKAMDDDDKDDTTTTASEAATAAFGGAMAMSMESENPYRDFRESMEAMVMSQGGVKDWFWLEEMLGWYLRANGKSTHGLIVGAFVDLLVALSTAASPADSSSPATPAAANCYSASDCSCSFSSSPCS